MESQNELPHDFLAEKALIGSLIIDNRSFDEITDIQLAPEDFYHPQYGFIFKAIMEQAIDDKPFDLVSVCARLTDMGKLENVGGQSTIINLVEDTASSANIYHYAEIVKNKATLRGVVKNAESIAYQGKNFVGYIKEFLK